MFIATLDHQRENSTPAGVVRSLYYQFSINMQFRWNWWHQTQHQITRPHRGRMFIAINATSNHPTSARLYVYGNSATTNHPTSARSYVYGNIGPSKRKFDSSRSRMIIVLPIFYKHAIPLELMAPNATANHLTSARSHVYSNSATTNHPTSARSHVYSN